MSTAQNYGLLTRNTELPFFPNFTYDLLEADKGVETLPAFNWIQAFFDSTQFVGNPKLVVLSGFEEDGTTKIYSEISFAYSGEMKNIKGKGIVDAATNIRDQSISSDVIGVSDPVTMITKVTVYGGMN